MRVLVLAPHTDDAEFGCGGTIAKLVEQGADVLIVSFSSCGHQVLAHEFADSCAILGTRLHLADFQVRRFHEARQEVLDLMVALAAKEKPDLVFLPNTDDVHQDHQVVMQEGMRAFKRCTLLGYELPWNSYRFESTAYSKLEEHHVIQKVRAMECYKSQRERPYANENYIRSLATVRGVAIGAPYAECFQSIRHIL